jgi:hypothetical protein
MLRTVFVFGDCSIDVCISVVYCVFVSFVFVSFLTGFMSVFTTEFVDLRNMIYMYVCMLERFIMDSCNRGYVVEGIM